MNKLELMRKKAELASLIAAKAGYEFKIAELDENKERVLKNLEIQNEAIRKIENEIKEMEGAING